MAKYIMFMWIWWLITSCNSHHSVNLKQVCIYVIIFTCIVVHGDQRQALSVTNQL